VISSFLLLYAQMGVLYFRLVATDRRTFVEHSVRGETTLFHTVHHKSHKHNPGIEPIPPRWEFGNGFSPHIWIPCEPICWQVRLTCALELTLKQHINHVRM
jgi:hypothetical protein